MAGGQKSKHNVPINWRNFWFCFAISIGQFGFGYPSSIVSFIFSNPSWIETMGIPLTGPEMTPDPNQVGLINGIYQAGAVINIVLTVVVLDRYGRKMSMYYNCFFGLLGGALTTGAFNLATFTVGRLFLGGSAFGFLVLTPIYTAELSPPAVRGFFSGMNGFMISFAYAVAGYIGRAFYSSSDPVATWRGPLGVYFFFPLLLIVIAFFAPESPRWLLMQGRVEEARQITYRLHKVKGDLTFATEEFKEMQRQTEIDRTLPTSWLSMFTKRANLKRTGQVMFYAFLGQSTAVLVINNYGPAFYAALGAGTTQTLNYQVGWLTVGFPFCFLGALLMDRVGRRPLMILGIGGCCACVIVLAAAQANIDSSPFSLGALGVAALYVFIAVYSIGVDVGGNVFYAEVFPNHIRSKGVALANVSLALSDLVYLQVTPLAQSTIGWKYWLVFIIISGLGAITLYFVLPETKGLSLEELGRLFGDEDVVVYASDDLGREKSISNPSGSDDEGSKNGGVPHKEMV